MIEKKIKEKEAELKMVEEKQKRLEESLKAYERWLKNSKYKPKPIPLNRGIDSKTFTLSKRTNLFLYYSFVGLKSSASVTYINPTPWIPNIEHQQQNV